MILIKELIIDEFSFSDDILFYYFLLSKFKKPIIYNWDSHKISKLTGIHENKVRKHLSFLRKQGMIKESGKNLIILSVRDFCVNREIQNYKIQYIDIYKTLSFSDFKLYLFSFLIRYNQEQQKFLIMAKNPKFKRELKTVKKFRAKCPAKVEGKASKVVNSISGLAKYFNRSTSFVFYWLKKARLKKVVNVKLALEEFKVNSKVTYKKIVEFFRHNNLFYKFINNKFYIIRGSRITFNTFG